MQELTQNPMQISVDPGSRNIWGRSKNSAANNFYSDPNYSETLDLLESHGIAVHVAETNEAVEILAQREQAVGGLFHSTC